MSSETPGDSKVRWPQPGELWSLWDMLEAISALNLLRAGDAIARLEDLYQRSFYENGREKEYEAAGKHFLYLSQVVRDLGEQGISDSLFHLSITPPKDHELCNFVIDQCESAMKRKSMLMLAANDIDLIYQIQAFGKDVSDAFPSSEMEIEDAGSCIALGQPTAGVFHLMRALEPPLIALAKEFGVDFKSNWNSALDKIEEAVRDRSNSTQRANWADEKDFYIDAVTHFFHIKNAWRNYTMHLMLRFSKEEALEVRQNVMRFMQKLATKLKE